MTARKTRPARAARKRPGSISQQLRNIIQARGLTAYAVAAAAEVAPSTMSRFLNDERTMSLETLDAVAGALGLELKETRRGRNAGGKKEPRPEPVDPPSPDPKS